MFVLAKIKELLTSILNEIDARIKCVSSTPVVINSKFPEGQKKTMRNEETRKK